MNIEQMQRNAQDAAALLKSLGNEKRLMIVCQLTDGEKSVSALCDALRVRQSAMSQQLSILRLEGILQSRKEGQTVFYSIADENARKIVALVHDLFCKDTEQLAQDARHAL